jgi:cytochrome P450
LSIIDEAVKQHHDKIEGQFSLLSAFIKSFGEEESSNVRDKIASTDRKESESADYTSLVGNLILEMMFGGHETTTSAMCSAIVNLSDQSDAMQRVRSEVVAVTGRSFASDDFLSYDDIRTSLSFTNDIVSEVLRVQPPIAGAFRKTKATFNIGVCTCY